MTNEAFSAAGEMKAHVNTYSAFIRWSKVGTAVSVIVAAIVVLIIAS